MSTHIRPLIRSKGVYKLDCLQNCSAIHLLYDISWIILPFSLFCTHSLYINHINPGYITRHFCPISLSSNVYDSMNYCYETKCLIFCIINSSGTVLTHMPMLVILCVGRL